MTPAELKLGLTAAAMLLLLIGSLGWVVWDWLRVREKRKRSEVYTLWFNREFIASLPRREETVGRCWTRLDKMRDMLADFEDEQKWREWWKETWAKHHYPGRKYKRQQERRTIDGHYHDCIRSDNDRSI